MKTNWYSLDSGKLQPRSLAPDWTLNNLSQLGESWLDIEEANPAELAQLLAPLDFHPLLLKRCQDEVNVKPTSRTWSRKGRLHKSQFTGWKGV